MFFIASVRLFVCLLGRCHCIPATILSVIFSLPKKVIILFRGAETLILQNCKEQPTSQIVICAALRSIFLPFKHEEFLRVSLSSLFFLVRNQGKKSNNQIRLLPKDRVRFNNLLTMRGSFFLGFHNVKKKTFLSMCTICLEF